MPNLIGIYDGGSKVVEVNGHPVNVGVLIFRASENESAPIDYIAHYRLHYRDSILKYLKRLVWQKTKTEDSKPDADNAEKPA